jgi:hypothetical protein
VLAVSIPDLPFVDRAVREVVRLNPRLDMIARAPGGVGPERLRPARAAEVVRHTLRRDGVPASEIQVILSQRRVE